MRFGSFRLKKKAMKRTSLALPFILLLFLIEAAFAQSATESLQKIFAAPAVKRALAYFQTNEPETINEQIRTCEIPAAPFKEQQRAAYYQQQFTKLGLKNVRIDREGNVLGQRLGTASGDAFLQRPSCLSSCAFVGKKSGSTLKTPKEHPLS